MSLTLKGSAKRGDTLIEVMFAVGVFALVAIISVAVMNSGINNAERDLELVTARNELNAQAEALRFIHSSYISEKTLPSDQQNYRKLWETIVSQAVDPTDASKSGLLNLADFRTCDDIYNVTSTLNGRSPLSSVGAFVLNTRKLVSGANVDLSFIGINRPQSSSVPFRPTDVSARIIFRNNANSANSDDQITDSTNSKYFDRVLAVEGIWDFVVKSDNSGDPRYYDFYIQTCWYGPRATAPTFLDTVIRLYNPEKI